ncbi:hypothetical protein ACFWN2_08760 [Lentzea sp. NPDC058436]|uniref:hypothetical protein n=1 Tax=Lentzea sp. NPDC058436 TaxID=3346499 RepID=UPI00364F4264
MADGLDLTGTANGLLHGRFPVSTVIGSALSTTRSAMPTATGTRFAWLTNWRRSTYFESAESLIVKSLPKRCGLPALASEAVLRSKSDELPLNNAGSLR